MSAPQAVALVNGKPPTSCSGRSKCPTWVGQSRLSIKPGANQGQIACRLRGQIARNSMALYPERAHCVSTAKRIDKDVITMVPQKTARVFSARTLGTPGMG